MNNVLTQAETTKKPNLKHLTKLVLDKNIPDKIDLSPELDATF